MKITDVTGVTVVTVVTVLMKNGIGMIRVGCSRCTYPSIHLSFHCADNLKITVGCLVCGVVCVACGVCGMCGVCVYVARVVCGLCVYMWCCVCGVGCVCACVVVARVCGVW